MEPLYIVDFTKPFNLFVDASGYATSAVLTQTDDNGRVTSSIFEHEIECYSELLVNYRERGVCSASSLEEV